MLINIVTEEEFFNYLKKIFKNGYVPYNTDKSLIFPYTENGMRFIFRDLNDPDTDITGDRYMSGYDDYFFYSTYKEFDTYRKLVDYIYKHPAMIPYYEDLPKLNTIYKESNTRTDIESGCKEFTRQYWSFFSESHKVFEKSIIIKLLPPTYN